MAHRFPPHPPHPSHSPAPAWLHAVESDLRRLGFTTLANDMRMPAPVIDLDAERRARRG